MWEKSGSWAQDTICGGEAVQGLMGGSPSISEVDEGNGMQFTGIEAFDVSMIWFKTAKEVVV